MKVLLDIDQPKNYPPIDESENDLCRALWIQVLIQVALDAISANKKPTHAHYKKSALEWIYAEDADFKLICELAELEACVAKKLLRDIVEGNREHIDFRAIRKERLDNRGMQLRTSYLKRMYRQKMQRLTQKELELADT